MVLLSWRWIEKEGSILNKKLYYLGFIVITTVSLSACSKALPSGQADILSTERQETEQVIPATQYQETASEQELGPGGVLEEAFIIPEGQKYPHAAGLYAGFGSSRQPGGVYQGVSVKKGSKPGSFI